MPASTSSSRSSVLGFGLVFAIALTTGCVIPEFVGQGDETGGDSTTVAADSDSPPPAASSTGELSGPGLTSTGEPEPATGTTSVGVGEDSTGIEFIFNPDGGIIDPCDPWAQDCPLGEKCTPAAMEGGNAWDWSRCAPIVEDPDAVGEPCTVERGPTSGIDTCGLGAMCWDVDVGTLQGTCVALCSGSEDSPICEPAGTVCAIANDDWLILCLPACDPMLQDCEPGHACHPIGDVFVCAPEGEDPGSVGESCEEIATCDTGLFCAAPELVPDCKSDGCCTALCDVTDPIPPCLPGQSCTPYYEPGTAPEGFENVGLCALPV